MQQLTLQDLVRHYIEATNQSIFLTGRAGTGKTTLLKSITEHTHKRYVIVAPTGVAAINAGGSTIHSFFGLHPFTFIPFGDINAHSDKKIETAYSLARGIRLNNPKIEVIKNLDVLIIDEISMVRCDLLDAIDVVLKKYRNNQLPFGGVQLLMIGDLYQLPPVIKEDENIILKPFYSSYYFFESIALKKAGYIPIELTHVYRQNDEKFLELLNDLRFGELKNESREILQSRLLPEFKPDDSEGYITLTTHVRKADAINSIKLSELKGKEMIFTAEINGDFNPNSFPAEEHLKLKINAQVMFIKNNREQGYYNGKIGWIDEFDEESRQFLVRCGENELIWVGREVWENIQYSYNTEKNEIGTNKKGDFSQYPLRLAWAITIHKSQGLTFDKAVIDAGNAFATGQVYVALSRLRTLEGLVLKSMFTANELPADKQIDSFHNLFPADEKITAQLFTARQEYIQHLLTNATDFNWLKLLVRNTQDAIIPYLKSLNNEQLEEVKNWENWYLDLIKIAQQYQPRIREMLAVLEQRNIPTASIERFSKAISYFINELICRFAKPMVNIAASLQHTKNGRSLMRELKDTETQLRKIFRQLIIADETLKSYLEFPKEIEIKKLILNRLENIYSDILQPSVKTGVPPDKKIKSKRRDSAVKKVKGETVTISLTMFKEGKSIETIALERELKSGTIISHLAKAIENGDIEVTSLVNKEDFETINTELEKLEKELKWGEIIVKFKDKYGYKNLSFVNAHRRKIELTTITE
jgi:hypothetical protein